MNNRFERYNFIDAGKLKHKELVLYKFLSLKALCGLLEFGDLKVSYRNDANDPYEITERGSAPNDYHEMSEGFVSFTEDGDNLSMWGNYADKFRGARIKIRFPYFIVDDSNDEFSNFLASNVNVCKDTSIYFSGYYEDGEKRKMILGPNSIIKCLYSKQRYSKDNEITIKDIANVQRNIQFVVKLINFALRIGTKSEYWQNEKEYRAPVHINDVTRNICSDSPLFFTNLLTRYICEIALGPYCPISSEVARIMLEKNKPENLDVKFTESRFSKDEYKLIFYPAP